MGVIVLSNDSIDDGPPDNPIFRRGHRSISQENDSSVLNKDGCADGRQGQG